MDFPTFGLRRWPREQTADTGCAFRFPPWPFGLGPSAGSQCCVAVAVKSSLPPGPLVSVQTPPEPVMWGGSCLCRWPLRPARTLTFLKSGARGLELQSSEGGRNHTREGGSVSPGHPLGVLPAGGVRLVQSVEGMGAAHFWSFPRRGLLSHLCIFKVLFFPSTMLYRNCICYFFNVFVFRTKANFSPLFTNFAATMTTKS